MAEKKLRGRPKKNEERPGTSTASIRYVKDEALDLLHAHARRKKLTVGEFLSEHVLNTLK